MTISESDSRRSQQPLQPPRSPMGWTQLHSWIFLAIVAIGLAVIAVQNRYHYFAGGMGKAYRVDKLFGALQEFEPDKGWVATKVQPGFGGREATAMMPPPEHPPAPAPGPVPVTAQPPAPAAHTSPPSPPSPVASPGEKKTAEAPADEKPAPVVMVSPPRPPEPTPSSHGVKPAPPTELSREEKFKLFTKTFPEYGEEEFRFAHDDLYPHWKKNVSQTGTWEEFMVVYKQFVQWWLDSGAPAEGGDKLWKEFLATRVRN